MISLDGGEVLGLYVLLKSRDNDEVLQGLLDRLEEKVFSRLSLGEMENVEKIYLQDPFLLEKRGE